MGAWFRRPHAQGQRCQMLFLLALLQHSLTSSEALVSYPLGYRVSTQRSCMIEGGGILNQNGYRPRTPPSILKYIYIIKHIYTHMEVSWNGGSPKPKISILKLSNLRWFVGTPMRQETSIQSPCHSYNPTISPLNVSNTISTMIFHGWNHMAMGQNWVPQ